MKEDPRKTQAINNNIAVAYLKSAELTKKDLDIFLLAQDVTEEFVYNELVEVGQELKPDRLDAYITWIKNVIEDYKRTYPERIERTDKVLDEIEKAKAQAFGRAIVFVMVGFLVISMIKEIVELIF